MSFRVAVVSAYGRGHSLAVQLARLGAEVTLFEVSDSLGPWIYEESEGPFGIFQSESLRSEQKEFLDHDEPLRAQENGFVIWFPSGPVEMRHALGSYRQVQYSLGPEKKCIDKIAASLMSNRAESLAALGPEIDLQASFGIRTPTRKSFLQNIEWCEKSGVSTLLQSEIVDVSGPVSSPLSSLRTSFASSLEFKIKGRTTSENFNFDHLIWCLSSLESTKACPLGSKKLFPKGGLDPLWSWERYQFQISESLERDSLPEYMAVIGHMDFPLTHENFLIVRRTPLPDLFDVWARGSFEQKYSKDYLLDLSEQIKKVLAKRLPGSKSQINTYPASFESPFQVIGGPKHPIFSKDSLRKLKVTPWKNTDFLGQEFCPTLGWAGLFRRHNDIFDKVKVLFQKNMAKKQNQKLNLEKGP